MSKPRPAGSKRPRGKYSSLICLGCRDRRIRCDLPSDVEVPSPGELQTVQTPCYRCKRLGIPCVIRKTILGRPNLENRSSTSSDFPFRATGGIVSRIIIELPSRPVARTQLATAEDETKLVNSSAHLRTRLHFSNNLPPSQEIPPLWNGNGLLIHNPQSTETVIIIHALDTLRCEHVEEEWFRHLPAHVGHTLGLDLSIKALVAACAHARGVPKLTSDDCYQALALALTAVQTSIRQSQGDPNDDILASTALLAPFEGVIKKNGIPTPLHVEGLATILAARPATYPVTQLAREILDFHTCESAITACIQGVPSPFESIDRAYFANNRMEYSDSDRAQLKALSNELFIRIPRLVRIVRLLRHQPSPQNEQLLSALRFSKSLLRLRDSQAEGRMLRNIKVHPSSDPNATSPRRQSLHFASVKDFEALASYWHTRLSLLRLEWRLAGLSAANNVQADSTDDPGFSLRPSLDPIANEMFRLVENTLMCTEYARTLRLFRHVRLFAHSLVAVWGVVADIPVAFSHDQDGDRTGSLSDLLLRSINFALAVKPDLTAKDLDAAADIFAGGQPKGRFAELYGL